MHLDFRGPARGIAYKILTNVVVPRPIAWITSMDSQGGINLAPFSFFNVVGAEPPIVVIGVGNCPDGRPKHTARNIAATRAFVVNLVTENLAQAMNITAADFPEGQDEMKAAALNPAASQHIKVPRVAEAKVALECTLHKIERIGANNLIIAEVVGLFAADGIIDHRMHVQDFEPIGRLGAPSWYSRTKDRFELPRISYAQLQQPETEGDD